MKKQVSMDVCTIFLLIMGLLILVIISIYIYIYIYIFNEKTWYKIIFSLIKKMFIRLLTRIVSAFNHAKCVSMSNRNCMIQPTLINLHHNEYSHKLHYYSFDGRKWNWNQKWNKDKYWCECKKHHICEKDYIWNRATCSCKNGKYLARFTDDSLITCDEILDVKDSSNKFI